MRGSLTPKRHRPMRAGRERTDTRHKTSEPRRSLPVSATRGQCRSSVRSRASPFDGESSTPRRRGRRLAHYLTGRRGAAAADRRPRYRSARIAVARSRRRRALLLRGNRSGASGPPPTLVAPLRAWTAGVVPRAFVLCSQAVQRGTSSSPYLADMRRFVRQRRQAPLTPARKENDHGGLGPNSGVVIVAEPARHEHIDRRASTTGRTGE